MDHLKGSAMDSTPTDNQQRHFFLKAFANRLCHALKEKGHASRTAAAGVKVAPLAGACRCSKQMARKYALGEALPDATSVLLIAQWLEVSPGWLLFGENPAQSSGDRHTELVGIDYKRLTYILSHTASLFSQTNDPEEVVRFIIDIIYDASHLPAEDKMTQKMIDMAIASAQRFHGARRKEHSRDTKQTLSSTR